MYIPRRNAAILILIALLTLLIALFIFIDFRLGSSVLEFARAKAQISGVELINRAINDKIVGKIKYDDIVYIHKDNNGKIVLIQPNTIMLNQIMASTVIAVTSSLNHMSENSFYIPLGQITNSKLLAAYGPKVKVNVIPTGQVRVNVLDKFDQAGINQTRHLIFLKIEDKLLVTVPFLDKGVSVETTIPLAETIIVGEVPETYVNFDGSSKMMDDLMGKK